MYLSHRKTNYIRTSALAVGAFAVLFFSRTLDALGAPSLINFAHFVFVPLACGFALIKTKTHDRKQIANTWVLISVLLIFFTINLLSALITEAGFINVVLNFLLLCEPFIMLLAITSLPLSLERVQQLKNWIAVFAIYNLGLAYFQRYILGTANADFIYGAFFSIAGATVSAIVSLVFAVYYVTSHSTSPMWLRMAVLTAALWQIIISDTKLVLGSFLVGFVLFSFSKINVKSLVYFVFTIFLFIFFFWAMANLPFFGAYAAWIKPELLLDPNSEFYRAKLTAFRLVPEYYDSVLNYLVGLGPGHGIGRLGGWMMAKYANLLDPLGATHPYLEMPSEIMRAAAEESRHVIGTAMYGPLFSWAGLWSDLGILGVGGYLMIWLTVWRRYCLHDFSRYLVLATFATGLFPGYLEEPGSMVFTTFVIGVWWHEQRLKAQVEKSKAKQAFRNELALPAQELAQ